MLRTQIERSAQRNETLLALAFHPSQPVRANWPTKRRQASVGARHAVPFGARRMSQPRLYRQARSTGAEFRDDRPPSLRSSISPHAATMSIPEITQKYAWPAASTHAKK